MGGQPGRGGSGLLHYDGKAWRQVTAPVMAGVQLDGVLAVSARSAWVTGHSLQDGQQELFHFNGRTWQPLTEPLSVLPVGLAPDGQGGLWLSADTAHGWLIEHRTAAGAWAAPVSLAKGGASGLALIPGTTSVWAVGWQPGAATDTAIWGYGPAA